jgi:hypothetical protein
MAVDKGLRKSAPSAWKRRQIRSEQNGFCSTIPRGRFEPLFLSDLAQVAVLQEDVITRGAPSNLDSRRRPEGVPAAQGSERT